MRSVWNPQARRNIKSIKAFHKEEGVPSEVTQRLISGIISATDQLVAHPRSGRMVPEIEDPHFREVIWKKWRIIYLLPEIAGEPLEILNVLHSAQQLGPL